MGGSACFTYYVILSKLYTLCKHLLKNDVVRAIYCTWDSAPLPLGYVLYTQKTRTGTHH
jgi:hypothetical protein